jgi:hypothetical protein
MERAVTWACRLGPGLLLLAYILITAALDPNDLALGFTLLLGPTFILPLLAICFAGVWVSELADRARP